MNISERQAKIPSAARWSSIAVVGAILAVLILFDVFGIGGMFKWLLYVVGLGGLAFLGAYLVYLRTRD